MSVITDETKRLAAEFEKHLYDTYCQYCDRGCYFTDKPCTSCFMYSTETVLIQFLHYLHESEY